MSARQPFIPSRPTSRLAQRDDVVVANGSADFVVDLSNPDSTEFQKRNGQGAHKTLNIGGLLKMKHDAKGLQQTSQTFHVDMTAAGIASSENSDCGHSQVSQIAIPTPSRLRSSTPVTLPIKDDGVFRVPDLPSAFSRPGPTSLTPNGDCDAHIFTQDPNPDMSERNSFSEAASHLRRRHSIGERAGQGDRNGDALGQFDNLGFDRRTSREGGPVRISVDSRPRVFGRRKTLENDNDAVADPGRKRNRPSQAESEDERNHIMINKRYRREDESEEAKNDGRWKSPPLSGAVISVDSPERQHINPRDSYRRQDSGSTLPLSPPLKPSHLENRKSLEPIRASAWEWLLGEDLEPYVYEQAEVIEKMRRKWEEMTFEEWVAAGDESLKIFANMIDFSKDHVLSNVKRHNEYEQKIDAYNLIRDGQEESLNMVRKYLSNHRDAFFHGEMN